MAHIPDGFLSPAVVAGTAVASGTVLWLAARRSGVQLAERQAPLLGAATAFVLAAQMFNFPLAAGTSAHLLGGVLIAALAGPSVAMLVMFAVVLVQALLFQDGGIAALGANTLNLAVLGAGGGWLLFRWLLALFGSGRRGRLVAVALAAWGSALLTGTGVALELALSGVVPLETALVVVGGAHVLVGLGEAVLTAGVLSLVWRSRPDLLAVLPPVTTSSRRWAAALTVGAGAIAAISTVAASGAPDVVERAAARFGLTAAPLAAAPFRGYESTVLASWVVAIAGVLVAFAVGFLLLRYAARR